MLFIVAYFAFVVGFLPGALGDQQWMGRQLWEHHHRQSQPCTCQSHCQQREQQRLRHTWWIWKFFKWRKKGRLFDWMSKPGLTLYKLLPHLIDFLIGKLSICLIFRKHLIFLSNMGIHLFCVFLCNNLSFGTLCIFSFYQTIPMLTDWHNLKSNVKTRDINLLFVNIVTQNLQVNWGRFAKSYFK